MKELTGQSVENTLVGAIPERLRVYLDYDAISHATWPWTKLKPRLQESPSFIAGSKVMHAGVST